MIFKNRTHDIAKLSLIKTEETGLAIPFFFPLLDIFVNRLVVFHEVMLVFELSATDDAGEAWFDTAFHSFVETQRLSPFVRLAARVARVYRA